MIKDILILIVLISTIVIVGRQPANDFWGVVAVVSVGLAILMFLTSLP